MALSVSFPYWGIALTSKLTILGSTGSIGISTLNLVEALNGEGEPRFEIDTLVGGRNIDLLVAQALKFRPKFVVSADESLGDELKVRLRHSGIETGTGEAAVIVAAMRKVDTVMAAIVGVAGLKPVWAAAGTGAVIALANKEALVCCGPALIRRAVASGGRILPVDSEHNAIAQVLEVKETQNVRRLILTASGGPFRHASGKALTEVTPAQALKHPNWSMGPKITIDSATLANKGLELIEAAYLFDVPKIDIVIHPQSIIHSMVEYADGSVLAQMGAPDMRIPISWCLGFPERLSWDAPRLDLITVGKLDFEAPDLNRFPMLRLARSALEQGEGMPIIFNAANEIAVSAFLEHRIGFCDIPKWVESAMMRTKWPFNPSSLATDFDVEMIMQLDQEVRQDINLRLVKGERVEAVG